MMAEMISLLGGPTGDPGSFSSSDHKRKQWAHKSGYRDSKVRKLSKSGATVHVWQYNKDLDRR